MSKEVFIALIKRDIEELDMIAQGLYETNPIPPMVIKLASRKAQDILDNLVQLTELKVENPPLTPVMESKPIVEQEFVAINPVEKEIVATPELVEEKPSETAFEIIIPQQEVLFVATEIEKPIEEKRIIPPVENVVSISKEDLFEEKIAAQVETKAEPIVKEKEVPSLASTLSNKKIEDLKQAISLGDRFRFQRELFDGNVERMNKTFADLNTFDNYDDAVDYLRANFSWKLDSEAVTDFFALLNRRFI